MMKYLFDTSTLVAALVESHIHHDQALPWLQKVHRQEIEGYISIHTIAELYAVISRYPSLQPISPHVVVELIEDEVLGHFEAIALMRDEYHSMIQHLAQLGIVGGTVYDAVIVYAGMKADVDHILSLNARHFRRVYPSFAHKILVP